MITKSKARETLARIGIPVPGDFHALNNEQKDALQEEADRVKYRRPSRANGSRLRYFHARLQRLAQREG